MIQEIFTFKDDIRALDIRMTFDVNDNKQLFYCLECRNIGDEEWLPYTEEVFDSTIIPTIVVEPKDDGTLNLKP